MGTNVIVVNKIKSASGGSLFAVSIAVMAIAAMLLGYAVYGRDGGMGGGKRGHRHHTAMSAITSRNIVTYDTNPVQLKARIIGILVNNTMDLNVLNNAMNNVLNKIDGDMQRGGILNGLVVERKTGRIGRQQFTDKLAEYVKNVAYTNGIPLMNRDNGIGPFVKRYVEGGGGSGGSYYPLISEGIGYGYPFNRKSVYGFPAKRLTADGRVELLDDTLRRL